MGTSTIDSSKSKSSLPDISAKLRAQLPPEIVAQLDGIEQQMEFVAAGEENALAYFKPQSSEYEAEEWEFKPLADLDFVNSQIQAGYAKNKKANEKGDAKKRAAANSIRAKAESLTVLSKPDQLKSKLRYGSIR